jgi:predicted permease
MENVMVQVSILFILLVVGFICGKLKYCDGAVRRGLSSILLYITTPALVLEAFQFEYSKEVLLNMGIVGIGSLIIMFSAYYFSRFVFKKQPSDIRKVLIFASTFSNTGFLGLPIMQGLLGDIGVIYTSVFVATFNILTWTLGITIWTGEKANPLKLLGNSTLIAVIVGIVMFCFSLHFPAILDKSISMLSSCNTPLSMIVVGAILSESSFKGVFTQRRIYTFLGIRLMLIPFVTLLLCRALGIPAEVSAVLVLVGGMPAAANTAIFATRYDIEERFASMLVVLSTVLYLPVLPLWSWVMGF